MSKSRVKSRNEQDLEFVHMNNIPENVKNGLYDFVAEKAGWSCTRTGQMRGILRHLASLQFPECRLTATPLVQRTLCGHKIVANLDGSVEDVCADL